MKKDALKEIKGLDTKTLDAKVKALKKELADVILDASDKAKQTKDIKVFYKKRKDLAQVLTILRQKQLLEALKPVEVVEEKPVKGTK